MIIDLYNTFEINYILHNYHLLEYVNALPKVSNKVVSVLYNFDNVNFIKDLVFPCSMCIFAWFQFSITKKQRKDNLFDKRYEFYNKVIKSVQDLEPKILLEYKKQKLSTKYCDRKEQQFLEFITYDANSGFDPMFEEYREVFQDFNWIEQLVLNKKKQELLSIARFLFDVELVEFLDKFFCKKNLENVIRKHYRRNYTEQEILTEWELYHEYFEKRGVEQQRKKNSKGLQTLVVHLEIVEFSKLDTALLTDTPWFPSQKEEFNEQFGRFLTILN